MAKLIPMIIIILIILLINACYVPAPLGPQRTGKAMATTNCAGCTMTVMTKFDSISFDFPNPKEQLYFTYDSVTRVNIKVKPLSDQKLEVRIFDKDLIQVYRSAEVMAAAGREQKFSYQFKYKK